MRKVVYMSFKGADVFEDLFVVDEELKEFVGKEPGFELLEGLETGRREVAGVFEDVGEDIVAE